MILPKTGRHVLWLSPIAFGEPVHPPPPLLVYRLACLAALCLAAPSTTAQCTDIFAAPASAAREVFNGNADPSSVDISTPPDFQGVLDDNDPRRTGGYPYDNHIFFARAGQEVTVTMTATDFDTYLIVRSPSGQEWSNDDFGNTRTSQVTFTAATMGNYSLWASAYSTDGRGAYEVRVSTRSATVLSTVAGRLDYEDSQQIKGEYFDSITFRPTTADAFYVELLPLGFTGYLRVTSPGGVRYTAEQNGDQRSVRIGPIEVEPGTWTVDITTMSPGQVGAYDLRVIRLDDQ
jgi:hypothetical protein